MARQVCSMEEVAVRDIRESLLTGLPLSGLELSGMGMLRECQ